jgi:hypothetical protein
MGQKRKLVRSKGKAAGPKRKQAAKKASKKSAGRKPAVRSTAKRAQRESPSTKREPAAPKRQPKRSTSGGRARGGSQGLLAGFDDGRTLKNEGKPVTIFTHAMGPLVLTSGRIVALDPYSSARPLPFSLTVPPGHYPVLLSVMRRGEDERVAMALVYFQEKHPTRWELATRGEEDARLLRPGQLFGLEVDTGLSGLVDADAVERVAGIQDRLDEELRRTYRHTWLYGSPTFDPATEANLIAFSPGEGCGTYPVWWGLDDEGQPVCLVIDFLLLELERPELPDDPKARAARVRELVARLQRNDRRLEALRELPSFGDEASEAVRPLIEALRTQALAPDEQEAAIEAIGRICNEAQEQADHFYPALASTPGGPGLIALLRALAGVRGVGVYQGMKQAVVERLRPEHDVEVRRAAAATLESFRGHAMYVLPEALRAANDSDPQVRARIMEVLRNISERPEVADRSGLLLDALRARLADDSAEVRRNLVEALLELSQHRAEAWEVLTGFLVDLNTEVRSYAAEVLRQSPVLAHREAAQRALAGIIRDTSAEPRTRILAMERLGFYIRELADEALEVLRGLEKEGNEQLTEQARTLLDSLPGV